MSAAVRCDVVIPVYNALRSTRNCLDSVRRNAPAWARIVVINDASDARTTEWLREQSSITLLENTANQGFVKTANRGLRYSDAPYVCLLNSDTLLTPGALEKMVAGMERDSRIGLACPLSNSAVNLSVKIAPGEDVFSFARRVERVGGALYPDAVTVVGFCLLVRRQVITTLGVFDEVFGRGYCEETDLHYRARAAGWRCVVADDTFVYHQQGASFTDSDERIRKNLEILMARWRPVHEKELGEFDRTNALGRLRDSKTYEWTVPDPDPEPYDVLFVLPMMGVFGGVADVLELTNALVLEGRRAGVVLLGDIDKEIDLELFFRPLRIPFERFVEDLPRTKCLVATSYQTAVPVAIAAAARLDVQTAYFVQDYEGWFGADEPEYVARTYDLVPRMTAISTWLANEIASRHGHRPVVVPMSADPETFYPRGTRSHAPVRVVAMLRPDERRGIRYLLPALAEIGKRADVEIVFFGSHHVPKDAQPFPHTHAGILSRDGVAKLLATAHIVVDPSLFQGFGLVGLEGMASGAACVLTDSGGIREYAVDGENALVVPPKDAVALASAIHRLVTDTALRERLGTAGVKTARRFTWQGAARLYASFLDSLPAPSAAPPAERAALDLLWREMNRRPGPDPTLQDELRTVKETLQTIYRSTVWKAMSPYWKIKAKLKK